MGHYALYYLYCCPSHYFFASKHLYINILHSFLHLAHFLSMINFFGYIHLESLPLTFLRIHSRSSPRTLSYTISISFVSPQQFAQLVRVFQLSWGRSNSLYGMLVDCTAITTLVASPLMLLPLIVASLSILPNLGLPRSSNNSVMPLSVATSREIIRLLLYFLCNVAINLLRITFISVVVVFITFVGILMTIILCIADIVCLTIFLIYLSDNPPSIRFHVHNHCMTKSFTINAKF